MWSSAGGVQKPLGTSYRTGFDFTHKTQTYTCIQTESVAIIIFTLKYFTVLSAKNKC